MRGSLTDRKCVADPTLVHETRTDIVRRVVAIEGFVCLDAAVQLVGTR